MMKTTFAAIGVLTLLAGTAFAAPPPNDVGVTGMGGGVYYNPYLRGDAPQSVNHAAGKDVGNANKSGAVSHAPVAGNG
jgi:hypothetical protein